MSSTLYFKVQDESFAIVLPEASGSALLLLDLVAPVPEKVNAFTFIEEKSYSTEEISCILYHVHGLASICVISDPMIAHGARLTVERKDIEQLIQAKVLVQKDGTKNEFVFGPTVMPFYKMLILMALGK